METCQNNISKMWNAELSKFWFAEKLIFWTFEMPNSRSSKIPICWNADIPNNPISQKLKSRYSEMSKFCQLKNCLYRILLFYQASRYFTVSHIALVLKQIIIHDIKSTEKRNCEVMPNFRITWKKLLEIKLQPYGF